MGNRKSHDCSCESCLSKDESPGPIWSVCVWITLCAAVVVAVWLLAPTMP